MLLRIRNSQSNLLQKKFFSLTIQSIILQKKFLQTHGEDSVVIPFPFDVVADKDGLFEGIGNADQRFHFLIFLL